MRIRPYPAGKWTDAHNTSSNQDVFPKEPGKTYIENDESGGRFLPIVSCHPGVLCDKILYKKRMLWKDRE